VAKNRIRIRCRSFNNRPRPWQPPGPASRLVGQSPAPFFAESAGSLRRRRASSRRSAPPLLPDPVGTRGMRCSLSALEPPRPASRVPLRAPRTADSCTRSTSAVGIDWYFSCQLVNAVLTFANHVANPILGTSRVQSWRKSTCRHLRLDSSQPKRSLHLAGWARANSSSRT